MSTDRRVQRTRKLLRESLMSLILEKGYESITVQEITDRANLGRATLYLHYNDKEDLLFTSLKEIFDDLRILIENELHAGDASRLSGYPFIIAFQHAEEHADLYRVLLSGQGPSILLPRLRGYIAKLFEDSITQMIPDYDGDIPIAVASHYMSGSVLMLLEWWLANDTPYEAEEAAGMLWNLLMNGLRSAMGVDKVFGPLAP